MRNSDSTPLGTRRFWSVPVVWLLVLLVRGYQRFISSRLPSVCVFEPSCSQFAILALRRHGVIRGIKLTWERLRRCDGGTFRGNDYPPGCEHRDSDIRDLTRLNDLTAPTRLEELPDQLQKQLERELNLEGEDQ